MATGTKVANIGEKREKDTLYWIENNGDVRKKKMNRKGGKKGAKYVRANALTTHGGKPAKKNLKTAVKRVKKSKAKAAVKAKGKVSRAKKTAKKKVARKTAKRTTRKSK